MSFYNLKSCPLCGGNAEIISAVNAAPMKPTARIQCKDCGLSTREYLNERLDDYSIAYLEKAVADWNKRVDDIVD